MFTSSRVSVGIWPAPYLKMPEPLDNTFHHRSRCVPLVIGTQLEIDTLATNGSRILAATQDMIAKNEEMLQNCTSGNRGQEVVVVENING